MSKYKIGDTAWWANREAREKSIQCPDCFGQKALTVIKGDGSNVSIQCAGCQLGYDPPRGFITYREHEINVRTVEINRIDERPERIEYGICGHYSVDESDLFDTKEEAEVRAKQLVEEWNKEEIAKIHRKERNGRTWSWNACYHRRCIKQAEKDLAYHTAKLNVAKEKVATLQEQKEFEKRAMK